MLPEPEKQKCLQLSRWIRESDNVVWFTGAGISTESGLPDYRGPDGVWTRRDAGLPPLEATIDPDQVLPNRTHLSLVELEKSGKAAYLISQNVDGLHLASGFPPKKLAELHGNRDLMVCSKCGEKLTRTQAGWDRQRWGRGYMGRREFRGQPSCPSCEGRLYSTVVNFGDSLPVNDLNSALLHSRECDLFIVLGSSLVVSPAADLPGVAQESGARLVVCNLGETPYDRVSDIRLFSDVGDAMDLVVDSLRD